MTAHHRTAEVYFSRYNLTTVSIRDLSAAISVDLSASSLLHIFNTTFAGHALGFSSNTPGQQFIFYLSSNLTISAISIVGNYEAGVYLRNLLALPLYYFQPSYLFNASRAVVESNGDQPNPCHRS